MNTNTTTAASDPNDLPRFHEPLADFDVSDGVPTAPDDFSTEEPTQPIPRETLAEMHDRWQADIAAAKAAGIATSDRPTRPVRKPL